MSPLLQSFEIRLRRRPDGTPSADDFSLEHQGFRIR